MHKIVTMMILISAMASAQPTINGDMSDVNYTQLASYTSTRDGFGSSNDLGVIKSYQDGTNIYLGITGELTSNDNVIIFFNFSGYSGRGTNTLTAATSGGVLNNIGSAKMDMDVDYALAFNEGSGSTNLYLDAARYGTTGHVASAYIGSTSDQTGTSASVDLGTTFGGTGNIQFAYNNGFSGDANKGIEMKIPIAAFSGVTNAQSLSVFAIIVSSGGYFSNECIPGDPGETNPGNNWDAFAVSGQDFFTSESAMPVELSSFAATVTGKSVKLSWQTATEINNHGFDVERKQSGSAAWTTLGFVKGQGTSNSANSYSYLDNAAASGKYEYRLKQTDRDGKFTYSGTVEAVVGLAPASVELSGNFPNPFNPSTSISFTLGTSGHASLKVFDVLGKEVATVAEGMFNAGERNTFTFNAENLTSGVYYYRLISNAAVETRTMLLMK